MWWQNTCYVHSENFVQWLHLLSIWQGLYYCLCLVRVIAAVHLYHCHANRLPVDKQACDITSFTCSCLKWPYKEKTPNVIQGGIHVLQRNKGHLHHYHNRDLTHNFIIGLNLSELIILPIWACFNECTDTRVCLMSIRTFGKQLQQNEYIDVYLRNSVVSVPEWGEIKSLNQHLILLLLLPSVC